MTAARSSRWALVVLTELSSLMYSGTVFGWAPMLIVLRREGLFDSICTNLGEEPWCGEQQELLGAVFTFAAVFYSASGIVVGAFIDAAGPSNGILMACTFSLAGFYLFAGSWSWASISVIIGGYSLIGVGGMAFFQCAFKAQYAFPEMKDDGTIASYKHQTLIIAGATTLGDASVLIWLIFELISDRFAFTLASLFTCYGVITLAMSAALYFLWRECEAEILSNGGSDDDEVSQEGQEGNAQTEYGATSSSEKRSASAANSSSEASGSFDEALSVSKLPIAKQLLSKEFLFLFAFACVHTTRCNLYLGLLPYFYESEQFGLGQSPVADSYVNITSALIPLGCLCAPLIDYLIRHLGFGLTAQSISLIAAAQSLVMLSSSAPLQLVAAGLFVVYRANVFAFPPAFAGKIFGARTVGRLTGVMFTLMSPVQFILTPALGLTFRVFNDNFRPLNTAELLALLPLAVLTSWLMSTSKEPDLKAPAAAHSEENTRSLPRYSALPVTPTTPMRPQPRSPVSRNATVISEPSHL